MTDVSQTARKTDWTDLIDLKKDMTDMKSLMARMVDTLGRIAVIEDRQQAMAQSTEKVLEKLELVVEKQHRYEVSEAESKNISARMKSAETDIKALSEKQSEAQASFKTAIWMGRALWVGLAGIGGLFWLFHALANAPVPGK